MSRTRKGRKLPPLSEEAKANMSKAHLGNKHTEEIKKKMSISGKLAWEKRRRNK